MHARITEAQTKFTSQVNRMNSYRSNGSFRLTTYIPDTVTEAQTATEDK